MANSSPQKMANTSFDHGKEKEELVLGRFELIRGKKGLLGEGSFSIVQKGRDTFTGAEVAIKTYKCENKQGK